jgi:tetratricopeptide (TPR) repeat protein
MTGLVSAAACLPGRHTSTRTDPDSSALVRHSTAAGPPLGARHAGPDHPDTASRLGNLAGFLISLGRFADALPLAERALAITEASLGPDHLLTASELGTLAAAYRGLGRSRDALPLRLRALAIAEAIVGPDDPTIAFRLEKLAVVYRDLGRSADALPLESRAAQIREKHPASA